MFKIEWAEINSSSQNFAFQALVKITKKRKKENAVSQASFKCNFREQITNLHRDFYRKG